MDIVSVLHLQEKRLQIAYNHVNKVRLEVESCRRAGYSGMNTFDSEQIDWLVASMDMVDEASDEIEKLLEEYDKDELVVGIDYPMPHIV